MSGLWLTSDTHFGHARIIEYCGRPFTCVEEMDEALIARWNERVAPTDEVWHLGDFAFGRAERAASYRARLHGHIHLVRGNHDYSVGAKRWLTQVGMASLQSSAHLGGCYLRHVPPHHGGGRRGEEWYLHGHIHNKPSTYLPPWAINLSVEVWGYAPATLEEVIARGVHQLQAANQNPPRRD